MTARDVLHQWTDEAIEKIETHARSIGGKGKAVTRAAEKVRDPVGPDGVRPPDAEHAQTFRLQALAELMEAVDKSQGKPASGNASGSDKTNAETKDDG